MLHCVDTGASVYCINITQRESNVQIKETQDTLACVDESYNSAYLSVFIANLPVNFTSNTEN